MNIIEKGLKEILRIEGEKELEYWVMDLVSIAAKRDIVILDFAPALDIECMNVYVNDTRIAALIPSKRAKVLLKLIRDLLTGKGFKVA